MNMDFSFLHKLDKKNKEFYQQWFMNVVKIITMETQTKLNEGDYKFILDTYFKQLKEGGN